MVSSNAAAAFGHGAAVAADDFNKSGGWQRDEVVVAAPYDNWGGSSTGSLTVYWRNPAGSNTWSFDWIAQDRLNGGLFTGASDGGLESWDYFGKVLAVGDFDKDGFKDLAIGVPWEARPRPMAHRRPRGPAAPRPRGRGGSPRRLGRFTPPRLTRLAEAVLA